MQEPHLNLHDHKEEKPVVVTKVPLATSRFGKFRERFTPSLSKQKLMQLGILTLLIISVPLTVIQGLHQQDIRQHAAESSGSFTLKDGTVITSVTQLEQKVIQTKSADGIWTVTQDDYNLCPNEQSGQPGSINADEAHANALKYTGSADGGGSCDDGDGQDPWYFFGSVKNSTGADVFYTDNPANVEARWAGSCVHRSAHCHDRGCMYYAVDGPDYARVGGWEYKRSQDTACFAISTYSCARSGWSKVMGYAQRQITSRYNNAATKGQMMDRRCALSIAVIEVREDCRRNHGSDCPTPESLGFSAPSGILSSTNSQSGSGTPAALRSPGNDSQVCTDKTFSDLANATDKTLVQAATCLGLKQYCTVRGFEDGTLKPNDPATRAYVVAFLTRYHVYVLKDWSFVDLLSIPDNTLYSDIPKNYGLALEIYTARANGFLSKSVTAFKPDDPWAFGFKGVNTSDYDFTKTESPMTRGDFIKAVYAYGTSGKGKGQLNACSGTSSTGALKDPPTFTESESDKDVRVKTCGDKASLLSGHITSQPSVATFKDGLYVFAKGREDKLYVRKLTPTVNTDGTLANLSNSPWTELGKQIAGDILTEVQDEEGISSLSVIVRDKLDTKSYIISNTGTSWGSWIENKGSLTSQMKNDQVISVNNMTYSFNKGDESSENNLCMTISALPFIGGIKTNPAGSAPNAAQSTAQTSPAASDKTTTSSEDNKTLKGEYDTIKACQDANPGMTIAECCSKKLNFPDGCPVSNGTGMADVAQPQHQNMLQSFWSWLTNIF